MLQAVTFDFWKTLYQDASAQDERLHLLEETLARHDQPRSWAALEAAYRHAFSVFDRIWREEHRTISIERWLHEMLTFLEADLPEDAVAGLRQPIEEIYLQDSVDPIFMKFEGSLGPCARLLRSHDAHKGLNYTKFGSTETPCSATSLAQYPAWPRSCPACPGAIAWGLSPTWG